MLHNIFFILFCIITTTPLMSMEQYNQLNKNLTLDSLQSYEDIYLQHDPENHKNIWSHIASNLDASTKNILSETCAALKKITSRNNPEIYLHSTLSALSQTEKDYGLFLVIYKNMPHIAENLLINGANPNAPNPFNISLLEFARLTNEKENQLITMLKKHNSSPNNLIPQYMLDAYFGNIEEHINNETINWSYKLPTSGYNALQLAALNNQTHVVKTLIKKIKPNPKNVHQCFPGIAKYPDIIELLLPYATSEFIERLFVNSAKNNHLSLFKILVQNYQNDIDHPRLISLTQPSTNAIALMQASATGNIEVIQILLNNPVLDVNETEYQNNNSALMVASANGHTKIVQLLLQKPELQINHGNNKGQTALMCASDNGHVETVQLLLQHPKLKIDLTSNRGHNALTLAQNKGHHKIVEMLKKQKAKEECTIQ